MSEQANPHAEVVWWKRWLFTTNHKDVGLLYFFTALYFGFIGALLALMMRVELAFPRTPTDYFLSAVYYNQAVTMHGLIMIFWFLSPLGIAFANYFVPLQIGAKDLAFPRLNALSYWLFFAGGMMEVISFFVPGGSTAAGWTNYQPLANLQVGVGPTLDYLGLVLLAASVTVGSINFITSILWMRAPGMTASKIPMFTWFILFTIIAMLFSFPTLIAAFALASADRVIGTTFFSNPIVQPSILWDNLFWFFGHPEVYIVLLPSFGIIANIMPAFTGRPLAAKNAILVATAVIVLPISFGVWMHHMFLTGLPPTLEGVFSVATIAISIPFDVVTLAFIESLFRGNISFKTPMLFSLGAIVLFIIGGIMGVFLSSPVLDRVFRGSYFVVSHFHYVMVGAAIFGIFAGIYYWLPRMTHRMYNENWGKIHFVISFIGFNVLYFPMSLLVDMPRRIFTYQNIGDWAALNGIATLGAFIFAGAQIILAANLIYTWFRGPPAPANPWNMPDLEWSSSAEGMTPAMSEVPAGGWVGQLAAAPAAPSMPFSYPDEHETEHHFSARPLEIGVAVMLFLTGASFYPQAVGTALLAIGFIVLLYSLLGWAHDDMNGKFAMPPDEASERWPFNAIPKMKLGMWAFLSSEVVLFGSFIGAYIFIVGAVPSADWPVATQMLSVPIGTVDTLILVTSGFTMAMAVYSIRNGDQRKLLIWLATTFALGSTFMAIKLADWVNLVQGPFVISSTNPAMSVAASAYYFLVGLHGAHVTAGLIVMVYLMKKASKGMYTKENHESIENFALYWALVDIVWCFLFPLFYLL